MTWQGACREGAGVDPDVLIAADPELLAHGVDSQMNAAVDMC